MSAIEHFVVAEILSVNGVRIEPVAPVEDPEFDSLAAAETHLVRTCRRLRPGRSQNVSYFPGAVYFIDHNEHLVFGALRIQRSWEIRLIRADASVYYAGAIDWTRPENRPASWPAA